MKKVDLFRWRINHARFKLAFRARIFFTFKADVLPYIENIKLHKVFFMWTCWEVILVKMKRVL